jgi:hypothetical protein
MNNSLQLQHFIFLIPTIDSLPPDSQWYGKK